MTTPGRHIVERLTAERHGAGAATAVTRTAPRTYQAGETMAVTVGAVILSVRGADPVVAVVPAQRAGEEQLPCGPFSPGEHGTLEAGVRAWAQAQTGVEARALQQLCTLADGVGPDPVQPTLCVSYLALVSPRQCNDRTQASWRSWYTFFPWEDWRYGRPECLDELYARLDAWAAQPAPPCAARPPVDRSLRLRMAFGSANGSGWDEERVLERWELLQEAGVAGLAAPEAGTRRPWPRLTHPVLGDQTAVLARAVGELRRTVKYRPVVFELMPDEFTLFELQKTVEAILGPNLHKQNFRRLIEGCGLVEPTGEQRLRTGGRPARLYRFRHSVIYERAAPGVKVKAGRA
jgi:hypothetical protein